MCVCAYVCDCVYVSVCARLEIGLLRGQNSPIRPGGLADSIPQCWDYNYIAPCPAGFWLFLFCFFFFVLLLFFGDRVSLCGHGCPDTSSVD